MTTRFQVNAQENSLRASIGLVGCLILCSLAVIARPAAAQISLNPCVTTQRELVIKNNSSNKVWIGGAGAALRSVCVVNATTSCLAAAVTINPATGDCQCGTQHGTLACPGSSQAIGSNTNGGLNCQCTPGKSQCGPSAGCNANTGLCYSVLPQPRAFPGPSPFNWNLTTGQSATFCITPPTVTCPASVCGTQQLIFSPVWWSGGIFARTGCKSNGTSCVTGDCNASPNSNCPVGVGGDNPVTLAEFTLQRRALDFYDVSIINGANVAVQMGPLAGQNTSSPPSGVPAAYWCQTPGLTTATVFGSGCDWNFGKYIAAVPLPSTTVTTDYTPVLLNSSQPCSTASNPTGCPAGFACTGAPGGCYKTCSTNNDCSPNLSCLPGGNGTNYCQCDQESDCTGSYCGTQFIPGLGPGQVFLQQCGTFAGWWSADDLCANPSNVAGIDSAGNTVFNCGTSITDGDGTSATNLASLFGCAPNGQNGAPSAGNGTSCYNSSGIYANTCCGCPTNNQSPGSLGSYWPNATSQCFGTNTTWESEIQPWLVNLKRACPTAYSFPYDDVTSTYLCQAQTIRGINSTDYQITFSDLPKPPTTSASTGKP